MKKIITCMMLLMFSLIAIPTFAQSNSFIEDYLERLENSKKYTLEVAELMPEESYDYRATPEEMSFAENLLHIGFAMNWHGQTLIAGHETPNWQEDAVYKAKGKSKADIINLIDQTFEKTINTVENFDPIALNDTLTYFDLKRSKRQILLMLTDHITHHRGQMLVYLRLNGLVPPRYVLYQ